MKKLIFVLAFLTSISLVKAQPVATLGAFAVAINQAFDRADQLVKQAQESGLLLEVNGGAQVLNLITHAKETYESELKNTAQTMTAEQQQLISSLNGMLDDVQNHILKDLTIKLQQTANTIPFSKTFPQLTVYQGTIISPNPVDNVTIKLNGNFVDLGNQDFDAIIRVGNHSYKNTTKTIQEITFQIPKTEFVSSANQVLYKSFSIDIPYKESSFLFFKKKETSTFILNFVILPKDAGTYELVTTKMANVNKSENVVCSGLIWDSSTNDDESTKGCNMSDGWSCDRNSVSYIFSRCEGGQNSSWWDLGNQSSSTYVGWKFRTERHHIGTSGKLTVDLHYTRNKTVSESQTTSSGATSLSWGDSKALSIDPQATWKIVYHQFDGKTKEFVSSDDTNPYLKIKTIGNQVQIITVGN